MAAHVAPGLSASRLLVRGLDGAGQAALTLADTGGNEQERMQLTAQTIGRIERWVERRDVQTSAELGASEPAILRALPSSCRAACLVGGLVGAHSIHGLLVAIGRDGSTFSAEQRALFASLLEPFAAALDGALRMRELASLRDAAEAESERLRSRLGRGDGDDGVVGTDAGLKAVFDRIALVAKSDLPVLILGETGAGKEMVAREIHQRSRRAGGAFIRVNCGAIPPELIDSELFGHERGSFTGATGQRRGWFERADQGTLLLDEVGDLPTAAQVRLLRVLQDGLIRRVGAEDDLRVDVRIVAATHRDLPLLIQDGRFREDLWYRLSTFPIVLPPLRERAIDIAPMAAHFARRAARRFGLRLCLPSAEDLILLQAYHWPGNVRELAAVIDRASILGDGKRLDIAAALGGAQLPPARAPANATHHTGAAAETVVTLDEAMRAHIERALAMTHGRVEGRQGAARLLGINPHTLRARMRKLAIEHRRFRNAGHLRG